MHPFVKYVALKIIPTKQMSKLKVDQRHPNIFYIIKEEKI